YKLFKEGKSIKQIALERTLVPGTVEGHLAHYVREGLIDVKELIDKEKYKKIASLADELDTLNLGQLKAELSNDFSYREIRMAVSGIMAERDKEE
ncbi:MAG TPA: helicase, partial [Bacteroidales bacterium]|nr:helicase [Bacteroidales bacterium]